MEDILNMSERLRDSLEEREQRLAKFLYGIDRLNDPKEMHYLYLSYDHTEDEEELYQFWKDTIHNLIGKVFKKTYASPDEIYN